MVGILRGKSWHTDAEGPTLFHALEDEVDTMGVVKAEGAEAVVQVTKDPAVDSWPAWSPDGSRIAFVRSGAALLVSPLRRTGAEGRGNLGPGSVDAGWIRPSGSSEDVDVWRAKRNPCVACDRAEAAPHIPERDRRAQSFTRDGTCSSAPTFPEARFSFVPELDGVDVASLG